MRHQLRRIVRVATHPSELAQRFRTRRHGAHVAPGVSISNRANITFGSGCALYEHVTILNTQGHVSFGDRSHLAAFCYANVAHGNLTIGDDVAIGPGTRLIVHSNHYAHGEAITGTYRTQDITIGNNVFIGANCVLLPGTVIEDDVIVGAMSLVRGTLEANAVYAGSPVRVLRRGWHH